MMRMKTMSWLVLLVSLLLVGSVHAQLAAYWIPNAGCLESFDDGWRYTRQAGLPLMIQVESLECVEGEYYELDGAGDLCHARLTSYCPATSHDEFWSTYTPALKILDYPLTTDKTWTAQASWQSSDGGLARTTYLTGTVVGPRVVETGIGALPVIEVTLNYVSSGSAPSGTRTWYLHEQLGRVNDLVSVTDCAPVAASGPSWSGVKTIYR
ncbi:MAG: hypothetical protein R6X25_00055 [Candidatus Krumholzibacteriia bacterium]